MFDTRILHKHKDKMFLLSLGWVLHTLRIRKLVLGSSTRPNKSSKPLCSWFSYYY